MIEIICIIAVVFALLTALVFYEGKRELKFFKVTRYNLCVPKLSKLDSEKKIVLLADLHNKVYGDENEILLDAILKEKPDVILIPGDMLVGKKKPEFKEAQEFLCKLPKICPVYYSLGNHEQRMKTYPEIYGEHVFTEFKEKLENAGIVFLQNEHITFQEDRLKIDVAGLELPMDTYEKFKHHDVSEKVIEEKIGKASEEKFQILLAHNPVFFSTYKAWGADLTLSGHLHGGIIRIPGLGGMITPQAVLFPKYSGEMTVEGEQAIVVSRGLGTHTINFRIFNPAEVVSIKLLPYSVEREKKNVL